MDFSHYSADVVQMAADLVNTRGVVTDSDSLASPAGLARFLAEHGTGWHDQPWWRSADPDEADVAHVRALRDRLRSVFEATSEADAVAVLNDLLVETGARPRISLHNRPHLHVDPESGSIADWLGSAAAMALASVIVESGFDRLGICESSSCRDAFVDTSRNRSRRHCSTTCTTRENVAAYRARAKQT